MVISPSKASLAFTSATFGSSDEAIEGLFNAILSLIPSQGFTAIGVLDCALELLRATEDGNEEIAVNELLLLTVLTE